VLELSLLRIGLLNGLATLGRSRGAIGRVLVKHFAFRSTDSDMSFSPPLTSKITQNNEFVNKYYNRK